MRNIHRKIVRCLKIPNLLTTCSIRLGSVVFDIPKIDSYMCEPSEPWMFDLLQVLVPGFPGVFLDVGVNLGQTLLMLKSASAKTPYVGLEPNPLCVAYVDHLAKLNGLTEYVVIPVGLGREAGIFKLQLFHGKSVDSSASLVPDFRPEQPVSHSVCVPVFPYHEIERVASLNELAIVKIDVEGAEADVLASMADALQVHSPIVLVEILPCYCPDNHQRLERQYAIENLMKELGYNIYRIRKTADGRLNSLQLIPEIGVHGDITLSDYLLCPKTEHSRLKQMFTVE